MTELSTSGLVLRVLDYSETSQIARVLTPQGVLNVLAKGIKRPKSQLGGPLDAPVYVALTVSVKPGHDPLHPLIACRQVEWFHGLRTSLVSWHAAELLREILVTIPTPEPDAAHTLDLALKSMRALNTGHAPSPVCVRFMASILRLHGLAPGLDACVLTGRPASGQVAVTFSFREMGLLSPPAAKNAPDTIRLVPQMLALLRAVFATEKLKTEFQRPLWTQALEIVVKLTELALGHRLYSPPLLAIEMRRAAR